jgi:NAD(P)-dependent dehydrogenase (short-subunit alcohol dehydrogenase family)
LTPGKGAADHHPQADTSEDTFMPGPALFDLTGKVAIVTGGSRGIGRAIAERMAEHGARVVISSRKADACEEVAVGIRKSGGDAHVIACNIARRDEVEALIAGATKHYGKIDILVCNAAVNPYYGPLLDITDGIEVFIQLPLVGRADLASDLPGIRQDRIQHAFIPPLHLVFKQAVECE